MPFSPAANPRQSASCLLVRHDAALEPVMDREDAVIGRHRDELVHHAPRSRAGWRYDALARALSAGAILRQIAGDDADRVEADARAVEVEAGGLDRLVEIAADAGIGDGPLGVGDGEVVERFLDALMRRSPRRGYWRARTD